MKNHGSGNKESSKERNKTPGQTTETWLVFLDLGKLIHLQAWVTEGSASLPHHPQGKWFFVGLEKTTMVLSRMTEPRPDQSGLLKYDLILGLATKDGEMVAPGSLCTSCHGDRDSFPQTSVERACCAPLPLPRIWQAQARVPTWYLLFFLLSACKHEHHELPS